MTPEGKARIAEANRNRVFTPEMRKKLSIAGTGRKHTEASKQKMRKNRKGIMKTDAMKRAMSLQRTWSKEKIFSFIKPNPKTDCWLWTGFTNSDGYGYIGSKSVHREIFKMYKRLPEGKSVLHKCDVRNCVNPDHLYAGTQQQNIKDMMKRGRHVKRGCKI